MKPRSAAPALVASAICTADALHALAPEWRALCAATPSCTPFQYPEWLLPWWTHFGSAGGELRALALRDPDDGRLVGLAPLYCRRDPDGARRLAFIGTGNTDYVDLIAADPHRPASVGAIARYIEIESDCWDECDLHPVPASSPLRSLMRVGSCSVAQQVADVFPQLALRPSTVSDSVPRPLLAQLAYARRRLARTARVSVEHAGSARAVSGFRELRALHDARWRARGEPGVLADERTCRFHEDVVQGMSTAGMLRLHLLRVDDRPAAAFYGFACGGRLYFYLGGFDPAFERASVGSLAILEALEFAVSRGDTRLDFLRGPEPYKYRWGAVDHYGYRLTIARRGSASEVRNIA